MDLFDDIDLSEIVPLIVMGAVAEAKSLKTARNTGQPGGDYLFELLECGNDKRIYSVLRMKKETFERLCLWLRMNTTLKDSRHIQVNEQVFIFLWIINFDASMWETGERFQHSTETISL
jgi:hypothetical protein